MKRTRELTNNRPIQGRSANAEKRRFQVSAFGVEEIIEEAEGKEGQRG